jgi:hypothetical protein
LAILALKISLVAIFFAAALGNATAAVAEGPGNDRGLYQPRVTVLVVPQPVLPEDLSMIEGAAVGLMNSALGEAGPEQTWLDVSQGARAFDAKYDAPLNIASVNPPFVFGWEKVLERAESTGVDIRPGLMGSVLRRNGLVPEVSGRDGASDPSSLAVVSLNGRLTGAPAQCPGPQCRSAVTVATVSLETAAALSGQRDRGEMMVVIERPPAASGEQLAIAVAGPGFAGMLRSASTRTPGYVLSTDLAPTVLRHFGIGIPPAMTGLPIESGGEVDFDALAELEGRYRQVGERKGTAMLIPLLVWFLIAGAVVLAGRGRYTSIALSTLCLSVVLLPATLLLTASLSPTAGLESAVAGILPVTVALLLLRFVPGWPALAVASGVTVLAFTIDLVGGFDLTPKAVIGPNPGLGARFYGIGNELESTLMVLTSIGTGAAIQAWGRDISLRRQAAAFLVAGLLGTVVFASGRFGADVGAAIIFPVAAVVGAAVVLERPRLAWLGLAAAAAALALLGLIDIATGSETHFVRSIFEGGSGDSARDVIVHRLESTAESFTRLSRLPVTLLSLAVIGFAWLRRDRLDGLLRHTPAVRAGLFAAAAGSLVGALSNDSGVLFIQVGVLYTGLAILFAWMQRPRGAAD